MDAANLDKCCPGTCGGPVSRDMLLFTAEGPFSAKTAELHSSNDAVTGPGMSTNGVVTMDGLREFNKLGFMDERLEAIEGVRL